MSEAAPPSNGIGDRCSRFPPSAVLVAAVLIAVASASEVIAPIVEGIGEISVRTPPCGELPCRTIYSAAQVREWVKALVGRPFDVTRTIRRIDRHYTYLGYKPKVEAAVEGSELRLSILEAPAAVSEIVHDPNLIAAYLPPRVIERMDPIARPYIPSEAVRARPGDLVNRERMIQDRYDLARLGYDLVRVPEPGAAPDAPRRYTIVRRLPRRVYEEAEEEGEEEEGAATEGAAPHVRTEPLSLNSFDGDFDYSRRQLFTARLTYQRSHVFREFDRIDFSPYVARRLAGSLSYSIPYLLPESITRRNLFAGVKLYDEFTPDRRFEQTTGTGAAATTAIFSADQENHGARINLGLVLFSHSNGRSLQGEVFADRYRVSFSGCTISVNCGGFAAANPRVPGSSQDDISLLGASLEYTYEHLFRAPRFSWKFIPTAEVATKAFGGDLAFRKLFGEIRQHYAFASGFEIDTSWKAGLVDRRVPVFEEFALGGGDSLRGFERDDFLGRRFLSAQNNLWIPIPFRAFDRDSDLMATLQRDLKVALLLDGGSLSFEEIRDVHFARGVGIGLRYSPDGSPLLISFDFAWGFWKGEKKFNPYVAITRRW